MAIEMSDKLPSVETLIKQQDDQQMRALQNQLSQAESVIDQQMQTEIDSITKQYEIKRAENKRKYDAIPGGVDDAGETKKKSIFDQQMSAKAALQAQIESIKGKYAPKKFKLGTMFDQETAKLQQARQARDMQIGVIQQLANDEVIKDPALALQAQYKALGLNIPIEQFRPASPPDTRQIQQTLTQDIRALDTMLGRFTPGKEVKDWHNIIPGGKPYKSKVTTYADPLTGQIRNLDPEKEEDVVLLGNMRRLSAVREEKRKQLQETLIAGNPRLRRSIEDAQRFQAAKDKYMGRDSVTAGSNSGGSIEDSVRKAVGTQSNTQKPIIQRNKRTGQMRISYDGGKTWQMQ